MPKQQVTIPSKVYYCPKHSTFKDKPKECSWFFNGNCMVNGKCSAIELGIVPCTISAELVLEFEHLLEDYEGASPPMDRTKFAISLIEKARGK